MQASAPQGDGRFPGGKSEPPGKGNDSASGVERVGAGVRCDRHSMRARSGPSLARGTTVTRQKIRNNVLVASVRAPCTPWPFSVEAKAAQRQHWPPPPSRWNANKTKHGNDPETRSGVKTALGGPAEEEGEKEEKEKESQSSA
eukprot:4979538-Pyramimonas_sp.AAC.1